MMDRRPRKPVRLTGKTRWRRQEETPHEMIMYTVFKGKERRYECIAQVVEVFEVELECGHWTGCYAEYEKKPKAKSCCFDCLRKELDAIEKEGAK